MSEKQPRTGQGKYIVLEGGEGCGKDSHIKNLQTWLHDEFDIESKIIREPYDDPIVGPFIAELLKSEDEERNFASLDSWQQALLMNAARRGVMKQIPEYLERNVWVLSSRNHLSTTVYQGWAGIGIEDEEAGFAFGAQGVMQAINGVGAGVDGAQPDLVFILDVDPHIARERMQDRELDVFERRPLEVQNLIRRGYIHESEREKLYGPPIIDANQEQESVFKDIKQYIAALAVKESTE